MNMKMIHTVVACALLLGVAVVMLLPRPETFSNPESLDSRSMFRYRRDYPSLIADNKLVRTDANDMFIAHSCLNLPTADAVPQLNKLVQSQPFYSKAFTVITHDFGAIEERILHEVEQTWQKNKRTPLQGPIYAVIAQAPYYFDEQGRVISIQFNAESGYMLQPYNTMTQKNSTPPNLYIRVWLCFPAHDKTVIQTVSSDAAIDRMKWMHPYRSQHLQCFMECIGKQRDYPTYCGCVSVEKDQGGGNDADDASSPYTSKCLGPSPNNTSSANLSGYAMVYVINHMFNKFVAQNWVAPYTSLDARTFQDGWKCLPGISSPVRVNAQGNVECMSKDGRNCERSKPCKQLVDAPVAPDAPLACGEAHKKRWGSTGYDTPGHWCATVLSKLDRD